MSWKKHFQSVPASPLMPAARQDDRSSASSMAKYSSFLPEIYAGHPNRIQRYYQFDEMDNDSDIHAALNVIADFCTQSEEQNVEPFEIVYHSEANETEVKLIKTALNKWTRLNNFNSRLWYMFRNTIKYGDQFFLRDPETGEWEWLDPFVVEMVKMDEENGKTPSEYVVRGLDLIKQSKYGSTVVDPSQYGTNYGPAGSGGRPGSSSAGGNVFSMAGANSDPRQRSLMKGNIAQSSVVDAQHIVHLSLSVGMDINWPFGESALEPVFKSFRQKSLLEDAVIIYRIQRAPERRIFYIDTGSMPPARARAYIEQVKNEMHQRRIPNRSGSGASSVMDAAYNPMSMNDDYYFATSSDSKGSRVETLPGGEQVGEITDLSFFSKKLARGLSIPPSYLSIGDEQGSGMAYNDGKVGTAQIQEFRFNKYCLRLQNLLAPKYDKDFKKFVRDSGMEIDESMYEVRFNAPQNFSANRQIELDQAQVQIYSQLNQDKTFSARYVKKRYLNMSEEDIVENERMWAEENPTKMKKATGSTPADNMPGQDLSSVGVRGGGMDMDFGDMPPEDMGGEEPAPDGEAPMPEGPGPSPPVSNEPPPV